MPRWAIARFRRSWLSHLPFLERERTMFGIGQTELIIVLVVIFILFGHRLPSIMRSLGRGVVEFKEGMAGIEKDEPGKEEKKDV